MFVAFCAGLFTLLNGMKFNMTDRGSVPSGGFYARTCNLIAPLSVANPSFEPTIKDHSCDFQPDLNEIYGVFSSMDKASSDLTVYKKGSALVSRIILNNPHTKWQCVISRFDLCSGVSQCLTDECNCKEIEVFYCNDGSGCIAFANVCDGIQDCRDGSDECMCSDVIQCTFNNRTYCSPRSAYCLKQGLTRGHCIPSRHIDCSPWSAGNKVSPLQQCLENFFDEELARQLENIDEISRFSLEKYKTWCQTFCDPLWTHFCRLLIDPRLVSFSMSCYNGSAGTPITNGVYSVSIEKVCDGRFDCSGNTDEAYCPGRFYCPGSRRWIKESQVCDNIKDCPGGEDECQACDTSGVSNDRELVQNKVIVVYMIVAAVLILLLNIFAGVETFLKDPETISGKVDRILLFNLCFYDMLMGVCLGFIFAKTMIFSGSYCLHDSIWRRSIQCKILGCVFNSSTHGSLVTVSLISLIRCYNCVFGRKIGVKKVLLITGSAFIVVTILSLLPILQVSKIQDIFRASIKFKDNPFITEYNTTELERIYKLKYKGSEVINLDTYTMLKHLNNISSRVGMFDPIELGYYSHSPLCIQRIYGVQDSLFWYKIGYMSCIVLLLTAVSLSYVLIVLHAFKSSSTVQQAANNHVNNNNQYLGFKVMLMIGSQLLCWTTVITLMIIYGLSKNSYSTDLLYELTATIFLPLNSVLNPIFYSSMYKFCLVGMKNGCKTNLNQD